MPPIADATVDTPLGPVTGHLAEPDGDGTVPAVLVLHELFGLTPEMRGHADRLAAAGYLALAPDLYSWGARPRCIAATMAAMARGRGEALGVLDATRQWLADHARSTGAVGVVGFCMGGGLALVHAPKGGYGAAAPNYGHVPPHAEQALEGICPVVASFGGRDPMLRGHAARLEQALDGLGVPHDVHVYPEATHGFMNGQSGPVTRLSTRLMRIRHDPEAAEDTWRRILAFFERYLQHTD
ncbi:MAG TPA: dienelactone hydrolase family protein [Acidimicrobiales bacterium]|nr:dienelactone hydrolase family protein [Acidimicrobiales bacterium]